MSQQDSLPPSPTPSPAPSNPVATGDPCGSCAAQSATPQIPAYWTLDEADDAANTSSRLPVRSFNHISREVLNLKKSLHFYCDTMGFRRVRRPAFESEGVWLWGYGLSLHLIQSTVPSARQEVINMRIKHFTTQLPAVDHIAFISDDIQGIVSMLKERKVYFKAELFGPTSALTGIQQLFLFDPDGNVVEISNCAPPVNHVRCASEAATSTTNTGANTPAVRPEEITNAEDAPMPVPPAAPSAL